MSGTLSNLRAQLTSPEVISRREAAQSLASLGSDAAEAVRELVQAVADEDEQVRECATSALEESGDPPTEAEAFLIQQLASPQPDVAYWAATLLGRLGGQARSAVAPLAHLLRESPHLAARQRIAWALGKIMQQLGPDSLDPSLRAELEQELRAAAGADDPRLARLASEALGAWSH